MFTFSTLQVIGKITESSFLKNYSFVLNCWGGISGRVDIFLDLLKVEEW